MTNRVMKNLSQHKIVTPHLPDSLLLPGVAEASFETPFRRPPHVISSRESAVLEKDLYLATQNAAATDPV